MSRQSDTQWYPRYVGDYRRKTGGLSLMEHGVYALLLDEYFVNGPLDANASFLHRVCMAFAPEEQAAVRSVLERFFVHKRGRWHNERADEEIAKRSNIREKRKGAAKSRWDANASTKKQSTLSSQLPTEVRKKEGGDFSFEKFWEKVVPMWQRTHSPAGSESEAFMVWEGLSDDERAIAFLVPDLYLAQIVNERQQNPKRVAKHVCRYLRLKVFMDWQDHCED